MSQDTINDPEGALRHETLANPAHAHVIAPGQHVDGAMDVTRQEQTFVTFMRFVTRMAMVIIALLILLALLNA